MAPEFVSYLATQVISEKQTVSYRNVSRALKVHVNSAKLMLYDFYTKQNKKKTGSIYATYLIAGVKRQDTKSVLTNGANGDRMDEDDTAPPPPSSPPPFPSSAIDASQRTNGQDDKETIKVKTVTLAREEDLESIQAQYESITSIHIYSLSPGRLQDLVALTDVNRGIYTDTFASQDPIKDNKVYGVIQNTGVRRRKGKRSNVIEAQAMKMQPTKQESDDKKTASKPALISTVSKDSKEESRPGSRDSSISTSSTKQPNLKRDGSNLFKAFAKAQNKPKLERNDTDASTNASISGKEDVKMTDAENDDEGESEDEALFLDTGTRKASTSKKRGADIKKEREDKQAKLRKMMDDSSSDDEDDDEDGKRRALPNVEDASGIKTEPVAAKKGGTEGESANSAEEKEDVVWSESDTEKQRQSAPHKDSSTKNKNGETKAISTEPKRKRGKRKVMKKRTTKDEDGYLVTKEEAVWESFSETDDNEDSESKKAKTKNRKDAFPNTKSSSQTQSQNSSQKGSAKTGGGGGGGGGGSVGGGTKKKGDIMSFFGKK